MPTTTPLRPENAHPGDARWATLRSRLKWDHLDLYEAVYATLYALPAYFKSSLHITGVLATDLFTFNSALNRNL